MLKKLINWFKKKAPNKWAGSPIDSPSVPRVQKVWLGRSKGREVIVESLPVERYLQIIPVLNDIPVILYKRMQYKEDPAEFITAASDVVKEEVMQVLELASGLDKEFLTKECSLAELVRFVRALYEVNEIEYVAGEVKGMAKGVVSRAVTQHNNATGG